MLGRLGGSARSSSRRSSSRRSIVRRSRTACSPRGTVELGTPSRACASYLPDGKDDLVGGFGPGISSSVAEKFGAEGFSVAIVARNGDRLALGVKALTDKNVKAVAFTTDLGDVRAVRALIPKVREALGPITVVTGTRIRPAPATFLDVDPTALHGVIDLAVGSLLAAVQESLADLRSQKGESAVLVTNGGLGYFDAQVDAIAAKANLMGLALGNAAKHKAVGMLFTQTEGRRSLRRRGRRHGTVRGAPSTRAMRRSIRKRSPRNSGSSTVPGPTSPLEFELSDDARGSSRTSRSGADRSRRRRASP